MWSWWLLLDRSGCCQVAYVLILVTIESAYPHSCPPSSYSLRIIAWLISCLMWVIPWPSALLRLELNIYLAWISLVEILRLFLADSVGMGKRLYINFHNFYNIYNYLEMQVFCCATKFIVLLNILTLQVLKKNWVSNFSNDMSLVTKSSKHPEKSCWADLRI